MAEAVGVALLGAGSFARDAHLPSIASVPQLRLRAVWSRSQRSAEALLPLAQGFAPDCSVFHGDDGLQAVLGLPEVDAAIVALPPQAQPAVIQAALKAGKHVLSEKPAAPTLEACEQLLAFHATLPSPRPLWCVAENYRSMDAFLRLRELVQAGGLGQIVRLDAVADLTMDPQNKYYASDWRRDAVGMPGAYLTEGGVHFVAALRMVARAAGWGEAVAATATSRSLRPEDLPSPDTIVGTVLFAGPGTTDGASTDGATGAPGSAQPQLASASFSMSMAAGLMRVAVTATGTRGTAEAARGGLGGRGRLFRLRSQCAGDVAPSEQEVPDSGVGAELLAFARLVQASAPAATSSATRAAETADAGATDGSDPGPGARESAHAVGATASGTVGLTTRAPGIGQAAGRESPLGAGLARMGSAPLESMPSEEDAYRVSPVEAARDLAVVLALLESAAKGGTAVVVRQLPV